MCSYKFNMEDLNGTSIFFMPFWIKRVLEESDEEAKEMNSPCGSKLLGLTLRKIVWNICAMIRVRAKGVPGLACRLIERCITARVEEGRNLDRTEWDNFKHGLAVRLPLIMASAIQIAAKMSHVSDAVKASVIQKALQIRGSTYSIKDIVQSEYEVLKDLGFRVPIWTSVDVALLLATEIGMPHGMTSVVELIVNLAEFNRFKLEYDMSHTDNPSSSSCMVRKRLRTLHLTAGSVIAAVRYYALAEQDSVEKLAIITRAPAAFIACIADYLTQYLADDELPYLPLPRKRRYSEL